MVGNTASAQDKTVAIHGAATPGGGFPVYGAAYDETINETDATLSVQPKNTKGSTENVPLLEAGTLDTGQDAAVNTVGSWAFVPALGDDVAYRLMRALHKSEAAIGKRLEQARESNMANTLAAAPRVDLIHPGAQRYLREIGLLK